MKVEMRYIDEVTEKVSDEIRNLVCRQILDECWLDGCDDNKGNDYGDVNALFDELRVIETAAYEGKIKLSTHFPDRLETLFYRAGKGDHYGSLNELKNIANRMIEA
ncbi:hypothetical protein MTBBW1_2620007 [Desulfamplus magnetovallimortis]|uniref:Uncharacterized protein n=1 Tax=Desulfamplus magnetovallimortis TaxID=1246637 RepID=A0A1W1HF40_9BACT|nr:hypothetical protein [Desulfamplus magnetovallimortis]SLM31043.1 hypothetical protein MTBBW1_2620007 [Desulfamplus magnetovallimortis]